MKFCILTSLSAAVLATGIVSAGELPSAAPVVVTPAFISELAEEARTNNLALQAAHARVEAAGANTAAVRTWDDPMVRAGAVGASRGMRQEEGDLIYGVEQRLPLFGKPRLAREAARAAEATEQNRAEQDVQFLRLELARQLLEAGRADESIVIGEQDLEWLTTLLRVAEERYRAGTGAQVDVLRLQNERSRRAQEIHTEQAQREQVRFQLNRLLNRDLLSPWPVLALPEVAPEVLYTDRLRRMTLNFEVRLRTLRAEVEEFRAAVAQTRRQRWPDLFVGMEGRQYSGSGEFREGMLTVGMNLPWVNRSRYRADQRREEARLRAAKLSLADYELFVPAEAHRVTILADAARREALLYRDEIIPRSQTALASAEAAWRANQGSFLDVLETRRTLNESRVMYLRAVSEQYFMLLELALCCGVADLEALEMLGKPDLIQADSEANPGTTNRND